MSPVDLKISINDRHQFMDKGNVLNESILEGSFHCLGATAITKDDDDDSECFEMSEQTVCQ